MKKLLAILVVTVFTFGFAACKKKEENTTPDKGEETTEPADNGKTDDKGEDKVDPATTTDGTATKAAPTTDGTATKEAPAEPAKK